jgi:ribosomal protein S27E
MKKISEQQNNNTHYQKEYYKQHSANTKFIQVICWKCKTLVLAESTWSKVQCPLCMEISLIPLRDCENNLSTQDNKLLLPNIDIESKFKRVYQYSLVKCYNCKYDIKTKRESDYVLCSRCKSYNITNKGINIPEGVDPYYYINYRFGDIFNPYKRHPNDPFYLPEGFEYNVIEDAKELVEKKRMEKLRLSQLRDSIFLKNDKEEKFAYDSPNLKKSQVYKPLIETIQEIGDNIKYNKYKMYLTPQPRKTKIKDIVENNLFFMVC